MESQAHSPSDSRYSWGDILKRKGLVAKAWVHIEANPMS